MPVVVLLHGMRSKSYFLQNFEINTTLISVTDN